MKATKRMTRWLLPVIAALMVAAPLRAEDPAPSSQFDAAQEDAIRQLVRDYILEHPEVLMEAVQAYRVRQQVLQQQQLSEAVTANRDRLVNDPDAPVAGNPEGDVVVVEFFDYRCPYCIQVAKSLREAVEDDGNIRLVMKEFPILGPESLAIARMALASVKQGKYEEFHFALMTVVGKVDEAKAIKVAKKIGLDVDQLRRDMQASEIDDMLQRNYALAQDLQINGTPAFVIGDELVRGALDMSALRQLVANARAGSS